MCPHSIGKEVPVCTGGFMAGDNAIIQAGSLFFV
jgi:hypothetical protein